MSQMIRVHVELLSEDGKESVKTIGEMFIANDRTGDEGTGNYEVALTVPKKGIARVPVSRGAVKGFPRHSHNTFDLVYRAFRMAVGSRNPESKPAPLADDPSIIDAEIIYVETPALPVVVEEGVFAHGAD